MAPWWLRSSSDEEEDTAPASRESKPDESASRSEEPEDQEGSSVSDGGVSAVSPAPEVSSVQEGARGASEGSREVESATPTEKGQPAAEAGSTLADTAPRDTAPRDTAPNDIGVEETSVEKAVESSIAAAATPEASEKPARKRRRRRRRKGSTSPSQGGEERSSQAETRVPEKAPTPSLPAPSKAPELGPLSKGLVYAMSDRHGSSDERKIAIFCDLENIALGVRDSDTKQFDVTLILERLLEKGKIIVKKAYADWERFQEYKRAFHEAAIELIDIPQKYYSGKNSADIKMVVDAMDLCYSKEHLDTFVIVSGDSDFSPLVSKLKENNKYVIGVGVKNSSSNLLISNCDEFIYYEDLWRDAQRAPRLDSLEPKSAEVFRLMTDAMLALRREDKDLLWGSMIKQTMKRKRPSFNEGYYGYASFSQLLEDAERRKLIRLKRDQGAGNYLVTWFAETW